ncbi:sarcosine oxidase subunit delta [Ascidiaceihabitans sp.]|uniref:sarcosine oxidase subunit delta n=1 Tax=Ascidiaceihabitans sp. TaxID=1872644 RepID=UPI00329A5E4B
MRLPCPLCGTRDLREFYCQGAALPRPAPDADQAAWADYVHLRDNLPGEVQEFWHHTQGCGAWLVVTRNTVSHEILGAKLAVDRKETAQ